MFSKATKERAAYWGRKLECPVDENANYENTYVSDLQISKHTSSTLISCSGATVILFLYQLTEGHGHGKALLDTGLSQVHLYHIPLSSVLLKPC